MPLILDVLTNIDERSAAAGARQLEHQFEASGEAAGIGFGTNLVKGVTSGFAAGDFDSMLGVLSSGGLAAKAATHGTAIGVAFAGGITVAAAAGLVDLGVKVGETFEKINRDITLHTAATGKALDDLKAHADALVGSLDFDPSKTGTNMAILGTRLQMGIGKPLDDLTKNVGMLQDRMGNFDVGAMAGALANMGVSGANADNTLASLAATVQRTNIPFSELATSLAANSELFKDLHLTTEQAGAMLGDLSAHAIPASTAMMGLQMGMKEAAKEGVDFNTFIDRAARSLQYYQDQIAAGKNVAANEAAAEAVSLGLGGPRKWTDELAAINALQTARSQAYAGDAADLAKLDLATRTLGNEWELVKNKIDTALAPGGLTVTDEIKAKMESLIGFIDAHATDLRNLFETSLNAIGAVAEGLGQVAVFLGQHPALIQAVAVAFGVWESIKGVDFVLTGLEAVGAWLVGAPAAAAAAGAGVDAAAATTAAGVTAAATEAGAAITTSMTAADGAIVALNTTLDTVLATLGAIALSPGVVVIGSLAALFGASIAFGSATGQADLDTVPFNPGGKAPGAGGGGPGTGRFAPGQGPDVGGRAGPTLPGGTVAPGGDGGPPSDLLTPGDFAGPGKKPGAPQVPYPAGYGAPPDPETAEQYRAQQDILEKRHDIDEAQAKLNQLEASNNASADDIQKAKNELLHAETAYNEASLSQTKKHADDMEQVGAKIDKDFGISKGLSGIADNLTKFLANLAAAPLYGAMMATQQAAGGGKGSGSGLLGMAGAAGLFGPQYTTAGGGGQQATTGGGGGGRGGGFLSNLLGGGKLPIGGASGTAGAAALPNAAGAPAAASSANLSGNEAILHQAMLDAGFTEDQWPALRTLEMHEAGFNASAQNPSSTAYGMGQFLDSTWGSYGSSGKTSDPNMQASDMMKYIKGRYGNPSAAWGSYYSHPGGVGWYDQGGSVPGGGSSPSILSSAGHAISTGASNLWQSMMNGDDSTPTSNHPAAPSMKDQWNQLWQTPDWGGFAAGGDVSGGGGPQPAPAPAPGAVPIIAHQGEHVLTAQDVQNMGGQQAVYDFRAGLQGGPGNPQGGTGATKIGGMGAPQGLGSGFTVTGGGLVGVLESVPSTAANMAIGAALASSAAALYGGAIEDLKSYDEGGAVGAAGATGGAGPGAAGGAGAGTAGAAVAAGALGAQGESVAMGGGAGTTGAGTGAGGGGSPGGSVVSAAINIGMQELNEAISKGGQYAGAAVGGLQQTFGLQQFAQTPLAQNSWATRIIGGIAGAQPQLPNMAGKGSGNTSPQGVPGMTPLAPPQEVSPFGPAAPGAADTGPVAPAGPPQQPLSGPGPQPAPSSALGPTGGLPPQYGPTPDSVLGNAGQGPSVGDFGIGPVSTTGGGAGSAGPALHIENYYDNNTNSSAAEIGRHTEAAYAAQINPGSR